ncbi:MAG: tetratricopeptide repeat protein, partial [Planctomycetota bacterium]|nr:tetratricopeptide repeat protein [Planctomycetota bacterium]
MLPISKLFVILWLSAVATAPSVPADSTSRESDAINDSLRRRDYDGVLKLIDQALPGAEPQAREFLLYRRALGLFFAGKYEAAIEQFDRQLDAFGEGPWASKAVLRKADARAALRQFEAAERIYSAQVRRLVGDKRKGRIAAVYLEFADEYFEPADALSKPDYAKARKFYARALEIEPGEALRDRILFGRARCSQKLAAWKDASAQYESYLLVFDERFREQRKLRRSRTPLPEPADIFGKNVVRARLGLGESLLEQGQNTDARRELQDLIGLDLDAGTADLQATRRAALRLIARTYGFPNPPNGESLALGVQTLETLIDSFPDSKEAIQAAHDIGAANAHLGRHDRAIAAYRDLIDRTSIRPSDEETRELAERLSQAALFNVGSIYFAQKKHADAIGAWNQYVAKYPTGPHWSASQQRIVDAEYRIGVDAVEEERFDDARTAWTAFLQKYPLDRRSARILYQLGELAMSDQQARADKGEAANWKQPIGLWKKLVEKFPNTEESGRAQFMIGKLYEEKVPDLDAAIEAYKKVTWSAWSNLARQRIAEMKATRLTLLTERSFRTNESPKIRVDVRNVDRLTVKLYRVVMEDYFRKRHHLRGVEDLDLLLIDPDKTFDVEVKDYARYKPITQEIEIPCDGPAVFAVRVSNENGKAAVGDAGPHRLEATTLVIRSDIDVIIKSSRREVLVFAQNMRTNKPAPNVRVLISDGEKIILDKATGEDGVCVGKRKPLEDCDRLSVFAELDGHVAGNVLSLGGLGFSTGLQPRGYIHTDRPVYRRGEAVNIRGILREVDDGHYVLPAQPDSEALGWKLDVVDAKGRVLHTQGLTPSDFGTFAAQFRIAEDAPVGDYKLIARRVDGPVFRGGFSVQAYELSKAFLRFAFEERVVLRGQRIIGSVIAEYHYGEPVVGKTVEYEMITPSGETNLRSGVTDKEGKIAFEFETTAMPEEGAVAFNARQADLNISASDRVFVAVRAFGVEVEAARSLVLSDEPVEVTVKTRDLSGEPIAKKMTLTALLRIHDKGRWSETQVETADVRTEAKTGIGRATLRLSKGGTYVLRAEGRDRFEHVVSAETIVTVSDDEDETRLRVFSDRQHYKVGESIDLDVHSRIESAAAKAASGVDAGSEGDRLLALVTHEGEEIIRYRLVDLGRGHNPLELRVEHEHFPNFSVGVAVMAGNRFHTASRAFTVERKLNIVMKPDRTTYRPRDEMTLELEVTDQQGKPVQGELGIVMIDDALLKMYPDRTPNITEFFEKDARRVAEMRTETSCTFNYRPATRDMVTELLAEARRLEDQTAVAAGLADGPALAGSKLSFSFKSSDELGVELVRKGNGSRAFNTPDLSSLKREALSSSEKRSKLDWDDKGGLMDGPVGGGGGFGGLQVATELARVPEFGGGPIELDQWDRKSGRFDLGEELRFKIDNLNSQYSIHDKARVAGLERVLSSTVKSAP